MAIPVDKETRERAKREGRPIIQISINRKFMPVEARRDGLVDKHEMMGALNTICEKELTELLVNWEERGLL